MTVPNFCIQCPEDPTASENFSLVLGYGTPCIEPGKSVTYSVLQVLPSPMAFPPLLVPYYIVYNSCECSGRESRRVHFISSGIPRSGWQGKSAFCTPNGKTILEVRH